MSDSSAVDVEAGHPALSGSGESHQAEERPLTWSTTMKTWVPAESRANSEDNVLPPNSAAVQPRRQITPAISTFSESKEPIYVTFEAGDPENPLEWSRKKKWIITGVGSWLTTLGMYWSLPVLQQKARERLILQNNPIVFR